MRYRTIVADPPWAYGRRFSGFSRGPHDQGGYAVTREPRALPYGTMALEDIKALPVASLADDDAHLYLWTTQRFLWVAPSVIEAWGFSGGVVLTWCKQPRGSGLGDAFTPTTEFVVFARRGKLQPTMRYDSTWFSGKRGAHSEKPDAFLDIVEQVSPGPYLEMFARRARFGWDYWGDESLGTAELPSEAV